MAKKILIADDEPDILKVVKMRLETQGYDVVSASDGQKALDMVKSENPDLVILDIIMPKIDGCTLFKMLRADPLCMDIPVIMLTASTELNDVKRCISEGAEAYLTKPFKADTLLGIIKGLLGE